MPRFVVSTRLVSAGHGAGNSLVFLNAAPLRLVNNACYAKNYVVIGRQSSHSFCALTEPRGLLTHWCAALARSKLPPVRSSPVELAHRGAIRRTCNLNWQEPSLGTGSHNFGQFMLA